MSSSCDPVDCSPPAPLEMEFSRQEHWSGLSFPSSGDVPDPEIEPGSPALQKDSLPTELPEKPITQIKSLVGELRSSKLCNQRDEKKEKKKERESKNKSAPRLIL